MTRGQHHSARDAAPKFAEASESLWRLALPPTIWALNFVLCYAVVSLACARGLFDVDTARAWLLGATTLALGLIGWKGWQALRDRGPVRDRDDASRAANLPANLAEDRHRFLAQASFLVAVISAIGTLYTALPLLILEGCL